MGYHNYSYYNKNYLNGSIGKCEDLNLGEKKDEDTAEETVIVYLTP